MKSMRACPGRETWALHALAAALAVAVGACGDIYVGSNPSSPSNSGSSGGGSGGSGSGGGSGNGNGNGNGTNTNTTTVNGGQIDNSMSNGPARASVTVDNSQSNQQTSTQTTPVAQQVAIDGSQVDQDESVEGEVAVVDGPHGTLQLAVTGVVVQFDRHTRLVGADGKDVTLAAFVTLVQSELQAGRQPGVHCRRKARKPPQAPHDRTFVATVIQIDASPVQPTIDCNIDRDHVVEQSGQVFIVVLDVVIELVNGQTVVVLPAGASSQQCLDAAQKAVVAIDTTAGTLQLADGTRVVVASTTTFGTATDGGTTLTGLVDAKTALDRGDTIEATVTGCPQESQTTVTVLATVLVLEDRGSGQITTGGGGPCLQVTGQLASVDLQTGTCRLADSTVVVVDALTKFTAAGEATPDADDAHEGALLTSLADARDALAAGRTVDAEVAGCMQGQAPRTILATEIELELAGP